MEVSEVKIFSVEGNKNPCCKTSKAKMNIYLNCTILIENVICNYNLGERERLFQPLLGVTKIHNISSPRILGVRKNLKKLETVHLFQIRPILRSLPGSLRIMTGFSPPAQGLQYMELIPKEKQPVTGTEGAYYRRRQLMHQLPIYDQDPSRCRGLLENELKLMEEFVKQYKSEALGVGEVALPGQGGLPKEEGKQQEKPDGAEPTAPTTNGSIGDPAKEYVSVSRAPGAAAAALAGAVWSVPQLQASSPRSCPHSFMPLQRFGAHRLCARHCPWKIIQGHCPQGVIIQWRSQTPKLS